MTKTEFIAALRSKLNKLPSHELEKTISFYEEMIDDRMEEGMNEEAAVADLGNINKIVNEILIDTPLTALIQGKIKESHKMSKNRTLWIVLAICGFPIWLTIGLLFATMIFVVYILIWTAIICMFSGVLSLAAVGIGGIIGGIMTCFTKDIATGFALIGAGIASIGLFIMTLKPFIWLCKQLILLTGVFLRKIKSFFVKKKEAYQ